MQTVELFCGTKSFSKVAAAHNHKTLTFDSDAQFDPDHRVDILKMPTSLVPYRAHVIWASPPCQAFSVAAIGKNWNRDGSPKHARALHAQCLVLKTLKIIWERKPVWWFIENPRGMLRTMPFMDEWLRQTTGVRHTVTYCQYGDTRMKPTDIWTNAGWWEPRAACKNGDPCHVAAPRGAKTGTQGISGAMERGRIPGKLFDELFLQALGATKIAA